MSNHNSKAIIVDGAACINCGPGIPGTWRNCYNGKHECNNCGFSRNARTITKRLPEICQMSDLTYSQRGKVQILQSVYGESCEMTIEGIGRSAWVTFKPTADAPWYTDLSCWLIGARGKTTQKVGRGVNL